MQIRTPRVVALEKQIRLLEEKKKKMTQRIDASIEALRTLIATIDLLDDSLMEGVLPTGQVIDLSEEEEEEAATPAESPTAQYTHGTLYERCLRYFWETNNQPASNAMIRTAIGSTRGAVAMVLYNTHADSFVKVAKGGTHLQHWKLSDVGWGDAVAQKGPPNGGIPFEEAAGNDISGSGEDIPF